MDSERLVQLLEEVRERKTSIGQAVARLRHMPYEDLGFAKVDHHRAIRQGFPEEIAGIIRALRRHKTNILVTRVSPEKMTSLKKTVAGLKYHAIARAVTWIAKPIATKGKGVVLIVCAGTSDIPVAEEALLTARLMGNRVEKLFDVGVAGIHRLLENRPRLDQAAVVIVVAGMEGALPSVVAGIIDKPVIAVPTSIGYGASFNGLAALLGMLNSCAAGVTVVNIDNGFGAGFAASLINRV
jgi:NCAIR mutase (PurE)-related protein